MNCRTFSLSLCAALSSYVLVSCQAPFDPTPAPRTSRATTPQVSLPEYHSLNAEEQRFLPMMADRLRRSGYLTTETQGAEYEAVLSIQSGTLNTDAKATLYRRGTPIAHGAARRGGTRYLLNKDQRTEDAVSEAFQQFSRELPPAGPTQGWGQSAANGDPGQDPFRGGPVPTSFEDLPEPAGVDQDDIDYGASTTPVYPGVGSR